MPLPILIALFAVSILLALLVSLRAQSTHSREGKILAFVALAILPVISVWGGFEQHLDRATSTDFCLSCHVMHDFGQSLHYDDPSYIPARHFQNNFVPHDHACYTCHTDYAMFGGVKAKIISGLKDWNQVTGISQSMRPGIRRRSVLASANRAMMLPCCS